LNDAEPLQSEQDGKQNRRPIYRIELSDSVRDFLNRNIPVDIEVCATGEPCAQAMHCVREAHVKVITQDSALQTRAWCADHWLAIRELYVAVSGDRLHYGPGALNLIAMRRTDPSEDDGQEHI
jgi:hypothetical protein